MLLKNRHHPFLFLFLFLPGCLFSKQPPATSKEEYVVLLHGLGRTHRSMKKMERYFSKQGYDVINLRYPSTKKSIVDLSYDWFPNALKTHIQQQNQLIHFIGHSLGGILVRTYLQDNTIPSLGRIVMLSPPNQGCALAESLKDDPLYKFATGIAGQELGTGEESHPLSLEPIEADIGVITGCRSDNLLFSALIPGRDDGKVAVEEAKLHEMKDFLVVPINHTYIMENPVVFEQAQAFIETGQFIQTKELDPYNDYDRIPKP